MTHKREGFKHYIGTSQTDIDSMLAFIGLEKLEDLYSHISNDVIMNSLDIAPAKSHTEIKELMSTIAGKNKLNTSFIGDGLQVKKVLPIIPKVCDIRGLTTAYTPYQPERSQGTLQTLWIYQNLISEITGFEAVNASLYERSTCLYEALVCATRIKRKASKVIVSEAIYPGDIEVINTQVKKTNLEVIYAPIDKTTGIICQKSLKIILKDNADIAAFAFAQTSSFGQVEDFNALTDICHENNCLVISIVDLAALANNGLTEPASWGRENQGADILVAEGQHLTIGPNFGGPGLGIFGIRYNDKSKNNIRSTAGRYIGKAKDESGRDCKSIILATREQHIRREKATSNICSNQSFVASACGAALLNTGSKGLDKSFDTAHNFALQLARELTVFEGVDLKFQGPIYNEITLSIDQDIDELIQKAREESTHIGVNISKRCALNENLLLISTNDTHTTKDIQLLLNFFKKNFTAGSISSTIANISTEQKRKNKHNIKAHDTDVLETYYKKLGNQNLSPDDGIYPLGSCTMKYNPEINDWAASLPGFTDTHPQAPLADVQGNLQILFETQELFKAITGLPGVTTQPLAGAQGEFVGIKMFQAYHEDNAEGETRNIILIPRSAHGTNPATATFAGYETKTINGKNVGIVTIEANDHGEIDIDQLKEVISIHGRAISGIMVTNPNTSGIFETNFKIMSDLIHDIGGLVYMDGANMNAIAGWVDLNKLGVDAVHNNLHKTWSIPHGGGGPGDAIVAVSDKLIDYLPGMQVKYINDEYTVHAPLMSMGSIHRHWGNFAHKVRCYTYLMALGNDGIKRMSAVAVLSARYLYKKLHQTYPVLPEGSENIPRMHEFILTISDDTFDKIAAAGTPKSQAISRIGKLFLDFGFHAPTVAFPEVYGLMLEPTESYSQAELDGFSEVVKTIHNMISEYPEILKTVPHFTPIDKVDELAANRTPILKESVSNLLSEVLEDRVNADKLRNLGTSEIIQRILKAHKEKLRSNE